MCVCVCVLQVDRLCGGALHGRTRPGLQHPRTAVRHLRLRQAGHADNPRLPVQHRWKPAYGVCYRDYSMAEQTVVYLTAKGGVAVFVPLLAGWGSRSSSPGC